MRRRGRKGKEYKRLAGNTHVGVTHVFTRMDAEPVQTLITLPKQESLLESPQYH